MDVLDRDVHDFGLVDHRDDHLAGEGDHDGSPLGDDECLALRDLAEQSRHHDAQKGERGNNNNDNDRHGGENIAHELDTSISC